MDEKYSINEILNAINDLQDIKKDKIFDKIKVVKPVSVKKSDIPTNTLKLIEEAGTNGITIREMTKKFPEMPSSSITSRPNELEKLGLIFYAGDKRDGSRIIRHIKHSNENRS